MSDYKIFEVLAPIKGYMKLYIRAKNRRDAEIQGLKVACDMNDKASDTIIPNLHSWYVDTMERTIAIERGEDDE